MKVESYAPGNDKTGARVSSLRVDAESEYEQIMLAQITTALLSGQTLRIGTAIHSAARHRGTSREGGRTFAPAKNR